MNFKTGILIIECIILLGISVYITIRRIDYWNGPKAYAYKLRTRSVHLKGDAGIVAEGKNEATMILWEEVEAIKYVEGKKFYPMYLKKGFESGMLVQAKWREGQVEDFCDFILIDNAREHHEAIWQMVLRHCVGREGVKIDPYWQAYWEEHQQA